MFGVMQVMLQDGRVQPLSPDLRAKATQTINQMALKALRCLAFAQKTDLGMLENEAQAMQTGSHLTIVTTCCRACRLMQTNDVCTWLVHMQSLLTSSAESSHIVLEGSKL